MIVNDGQKSFITLGPGYRSCPNGQQAERILYQGLVFIFILHSLDKCSALTKEKNYAKIVAKHPLIKPKMASYFHRSLIDTVPLTLYYSF
jgi:hypothetical protein